MVDASSSADVSPVTYAFSDDPHTFQATPSLGVLFSDWARQLNAREFYFDGDGRWQPDDRPHSLPSRRMLDPD